LSEPEPPPPPQASAADLPELRAELAADVVRIQGEDGEISSLMEQVLAEIERHEARRAQVEAEVRRLESDPGADPAELTRLRDSLLNQTRRELLFDAQRQVLEGKQRVLTRFLQRVREIDASLAVMTGDSSARSGAANQPALALRSQEELRRDIVRQLHDGPAQSLANIGLQAEIVERLVEKSDPRAVEEIESLRRLVQQALDTTKEFIFEIRPMVLDDLGLGPTLRRTAADRARRAGINVEFDARGVEVRLDPDIESAVYRSVDEALAAYLELRPPAVLVRLDWGAEELVSTVGASWPRELPEPPASSPAAEEAADTPPALLAMMAEKRSEQREADMRSRALPADKFEPISIRASALGMRLTMHEDGQVMELVAPLHR
jgi:two-component system sensor histidine kinase DegS